jgi:spore coat protein JB
VKEMNYNYDYGNYIPGTNNNYPSTYGYDNKMSYKGNKANVTFMNSKDMNYKDVKDNKVAIKYGSGNTQQFVDPYLGFIRGNLFNNLYDPYKNYKPKDIEVNNERDSLLGQIQMYHFNITDLNLYLDLYPNDTKALQLFENYSSALKELCTQYEMKYGPLMVNNTTGNRFNWIDNPWPWEENI